MPTYYSNYKCRPTYAWQAQVSTTGSVITGSIDDFVYLTTGETIYPKDAVFVHSDGYIYRATALTISSSFDIGFAISGAVASQLIPVDTRHGKLISGFSGLIAGSRYFLSESYGQISITDPPSAGSLVYQVGIAKSSTELFFYPQLLVRKFES